VRRVDDIPNAKCIKKHSKQHASLIISNEEVTDEIKNGPKRRRSDSQILEDSTLYA